MSLTFDPNEGLIIVPTRLWGPTGDIIVRLALDTGATMSLVNAAILEFLGYDSTSSFSTVEMTTGSNVQSVPKITVEKLEALNQQRFGFTVVCHSLPPTAGIDGVLGLDFFRGHRLILDFNTGLLTFE
jgi:hypothetical protein